MQPELVDRCSYCIKLVSGHCVRGEVDHWPTLGALRKSKDTCVLCSIFYDAIDPNVRKAKTMFPDISESELQTLPAQILALDTASTEVDIVSQTLRWRLDIPGRGSYPFHYITIGSCNSTCE